MMVRTLRNAESVESRYDRLRSRVRGELVGLWDVYIDEVSGAIVYDPISDIRLEGLERRRNELTLGGPFRLVAVAALRSELLDADPEGRRRTGSFRKTEWYSTSFIPIGVHPALSRAQRELDRDSDWLAGGPVYSDSGGST